MHTKSLVLYKGKRALVKAVDGGGGKILIAAESAGELKVREKDITLIHPGPVESFAALNGGAPPDSDAKIYWELLLEEQNSGAKLCLKDLASLMDEGWTAKTAWAAYLLLKDGIYFSGGPEALSAKTRQSVEAALAARQAKEAEEEERAAFLERLKARKLNMPADFVFIQDVEALALGQTEKSRTLREAGIAETPVDAHKTLVAAGVWDYFVNPYPAREGLVLKPARAEVLPPPCEQRADLTALAAYAIDNEGSADPDDALSACVEGGQTVLYVHVADPAASVLPGSEADIEARNRGSTVYLPENTCRMFHDKALDYYALGLSPVSPALSFKLTLKKDGDIDSVTILPSLVKVIRLTYEQADTILNTIDASDLSSGANLECSFHLETCKNTLDMLNRIARRNIKRRLDAGAAIIDFPEAHITVENKSVEIEMPKARETAALVRECMLLAGEGAACWAINRRLPFPFVSQECSDAAGDIPSALPPGLAGAYQLRRGMGPRLLSVKPGAHWGLGMDVYTQVTSPLRRYTDLLCHQQIRAALAGRPPLDEDEVLSRLAVSERGAVAAARASRAARAHWIRVYLCDRINSEWDAVILDRKGQNIAVIFIMDLGLETQITLYGEALSLKPGGEVRVRISSVRVEEGLIHAAIAAVV